MRRGPATVRSVVCIATYSKDPSGNHLRPACSFSFATTKLDSPQPRAFYSPSKKLDVSTHESGHVAASRRLDSIVSQSKPSCEAVDLAQVVPKSTLFRAIGMSVIIKRQTPTNARLDGLRLH
jgi:hypothetical protein